MEDFSSVGLVDIRGRQNYDCGLNPEMTCSDGFAVSCPFKGSVQCPASQAEIRAAISPLVVTNYDKWTAARKFGLGMQHFKRVVFDEGHRAPDALARAMQVILGHRELDELGLEGLTGIDSDEMVNWKPWANTAKVTVEAAYKKAKAQCQTFPIKPSWVRTLNHLRYLLKRLSILASANPENWIVETIEKGYQFDPVRVGRYGESMLLLRTPKVTFVSATLRPKTLFLLGIPRDQFQFLEYESDFDPARFPIYYIPTMRVDAKHPDLSLLWMMLDRIAAKRRDRKGIVQTISFARRDDLLATSRFANSMLINEKGEAPTWIVDEFKTSGPGTILASPSVGEGYDFPGDQCRWQFVCKIPFPDSRSRIVKARQEDDPDYAAHQAMNKLEQIFGRPNRGRSDWAENFIGDMNLDWFLPKYGYLATKSFHRFFKRVQTVPPPLNL